MHRGIKTESRTVVGQPTRSFRDCQGFRAVQRTLHSLRRLRPHRSSPNLDDTGCVLPTQNVSGGEPSGAQGKYLHWGAQLWQLTELCSATD